MTILPRRSTIVPDNAIVESVKQTEESAVPAPSDVMGTLRYWDEYRRKERARYADMGIEMETVMGEVDGKPVEFQMPKRQRLSEILKIDEFDEIRKGPASVPSMAEVNRRKGFVEPVRPATTITVPLQFKRTLWQRFVTWLTFQS